MEISHADFAKFMQHRSSLMIVPVFMVLLYTLIVVYGDNVFVRDAKVISVSQNRSKPYSEMHASESPIVISINLEDNRVNTLYTLLIGIAIGATLVYVMQRLRIMPSKQAMTDSYKSQDVGLQYNEDLCVNTLLPKTTTEEEANLRQEVQIVELVSKNNVKKDMAKNGEEKVYINQDSVHKGNKNVTDGKVDHTKTSESKRQDSKPSSEDPDPTTIELDDLSNLEGYLYEDDATAMKHMASSTGSIMAESYVCPNASSAPGHAIDTGLHTNHELFSHVSNIGECLSKLSSTTHLKENRDYEYISYYLSRTISWVAVRQGNVELLEKFIYLRNAEDESDLLEHAILYNQFSVFEFLIKTRKLAVGAEEAILELLAYHGRISMIWRLLELRYPISVDGSATAHPLTAAAAAGYLTVVKLLLKFKVSVVDRDRTCLIKQLCQTPIIAAAARGHRETVSTLVEAGAKIRERESEYDPMRVALDSHLPEMLVCLFKCGNGSLYRDDELDEALGMAVREGHLELAILALRNGADPNAKETFYGSIFQWSCSQGQEEIVKVLIKFGASLDGSRQNVQFGGSCPLEAARLCKHEEVVRILLCHGAYDYAPDTEDIQT